MYKGYKIVCNTAAGRRRYMQYLIPQVLVSDLVDRYDIWVNTTNKQDIEFFERLAKQYPKLNLVWQPQGVINGIKSINEFYKTCQDSDTIYIKLDDDVVWLEPDFFSKMVEFKLQNRESFVVSPLVINNAVSMYILQVNGKIKFKKPIGSFSRLWRRGSFAAEYHQWFIDKYLSTGRYPELYCGKTSSAARRFSINSILWFGEQMKAIDGVVPGDDEEFLSVIYPTQIGTDIKINGDCLISHFAFGMQRKELDRTNILGKYGECLNKDWQNKPDIKEIADFVQKTIDDIGKEKSEINKKSIRYTQVPQKKSLAHKWRAFMRAFRDKCDTIRGKKYIVG